MKGGFWNYVNAAISGAPEIITRAVLGNVIRHQGTLAAAYVGPLVGETRMFQSFNSSARSRARRTRGVCNLDGHCAITVPNLRTGGPMAEIINGYVIGSITLLMMPGVIGHKGDQGTPGVTVGGATGQAFKTGYVTSESPSEAPRGVAMPLKTTHAVDLAEFLATNANRPKDGLKMGILHGVIHVLGMTKGKIRRLLFLDWFVGMLELTSQGETIACMSCAHRLKTWQGALSANDHNSSHSCVTGKQVARIGGARQSLWS